MGRDRASDDPTCPLTIDRLIAVIGATVTGAITIKLLITAVIDYQETRHRGKHRR